MPLLFFYAVAFVCGIIVSSLLWRHEVGPPPKKGERFDGVSFPFSKRESLFEESDLGVYRTLQRELSKTFLIFPKVSLREIVELNRKTSREQFYLGLLNGRHIHFLLCDRKTYQPMLALQLVNDKDDEEHDLTYDVLNSANLPYIRLPRKKASSLNELSYLISHKLQSETRKSKEVNAQVL
jgi:hypothetical protein